MLMNTTVFTFILSLFAFITTNAITPNTLAIEEKKPIDLEKEKNDNNEKSLVIPFEAWLVDNEEVEVLSYHTYTDVTVNIFAISGQVLDSQTLSFATMQSVTFNLSNYTSGFYQIKITTPNDIQIVGTFMIE